MMKPMPHAEKIALLERAINSNWSSECESEFEAQSLAADMHVPLQLARIIVICVHETDEAERWPKLRNGIVFLLKIFALIARNSFSFI